MSRDLKFPAEGVPIGLCLFGFWGVEVLGAGLQFLESVGGGLGHTGILRAPKPQICKS